MKMYFILIMFILSHQSLTAENTKEEDYQKWTQAKQQDEAVFQAVKNEMMEKYHIADDFIDDGTVQTPAEKLYEEGLDCMRNDLFGLGIELLEKSASLSNTDAMGYLGNYFAGIYGKKEVDLEKAIFWHTKAAELNSSDSLLELGLIYKKAKNFPLAIEFFTKSMDAGNFAAPYALADYHYQNGNYDQAIHFCKIAQEREHGEAEELMNKIIRAKQNK